MEIGLDPEFEGLICSLYSPSRLEGAGVRWKADLVKKGSQGTCFSEPKMALRRPRPQFYPLKAHERQNQNESYFQHLFIEIPVCV